MAKNFIAFISHRWNYADFSIDLKKILGNRAYFNFESDEVGKHDPINSTNASYIKTRVKAKMAECDTFLVDASPSTTNSEWIEWEIKTAKDLGLKVIGILPRGYEKMSTLVQTYADTICKWNTESIVEAIRKYSTL